ncbi:MAG: hypothetical protein MJE77_28670 [Proteobacteria bacterium]|nr:hypothetical protein [Pseudomonadota bacterium]
MSSAPPVLSTAPLEHPAMDYAFLRQEGIRHIEKLAGRLWTDFNAHDPGITILEQLCYAITDLAYRTSYQLPDLLAGEGDDPYRSLYSPATILPCFPVTLTDLRKLVIDVEGVKNAWIERVEKPAVPLFYHEGRKALSLQSESQYVEPVFLKGLYRVLIEKSELADKDGSLVQSEAARRLHAFRNLCEDFEEIRVLESQPIQVDAYVEVGPVDDAEEVLAEIYRKIANYVSPSVAFATLEEMLDKGKRVDEIFEGPLLEHGFIDSDDLDAMQRRTAIHTSDLIHEISSVAGVRAVREIAVSADGQTEVWSLEVDADRAPKFDLRNSTITLARDNLMVSLNVDNVIATYNERLRKSTVFGKLSRNQRDLIPPPGRDRTIGAYYSIQNQFPALYGIGELGLPESASGQRKAWANQLKAYLMFFDQLLANYFAQLANARELFSYHSTTPYTYFAQPIDDSALGLDKIRKSEASEYRAHVTEHTEASSARSGGPLRRKNRFLNHLMARFAEQFTDYSLILYGAMPEQASSPDQKLVADKQVFLQHYPEISGARAAGFDYLEPWSKDNISGLERRIRLKLGLVEEEGEDFFLVEHILLRPIQEDERQLNQEDLSQIPLLAETCYRDPFSLQISFVFSNWPRRLRTADPAQKNPTNGFRQYIEQTIREETPAHLTPYIHWLDENNFTRFKSAYRDWLERQRVYWTDRLGI